MRLLARKFIVPSTTIGLLGLMMALMWLGGTDSAHAQTRSHIFIGKVVYGSSPVADGTQVLASIDKVTRANSVVSSGTFTLEVIENSSEKLEGKTIDFVAVTVDGSVSRTALPTAIFQAGSKTSIALNVLGSFPHRVKGNAIVDGRSVPEGTTIVVFGGGVKLTTGSVSRGVYSVNITPPRGVSLDGKTIDFQGVMADGQLVSFPQTVTWQAGAATTITLEGKSPVLKQPVLTINCTGVGTVTPQGCGATTKYVEGTSLEFSAQPARGWVFRGFSGPCTGTGPCLVIMDGDKTLTATFALTKVALSIGCTGSGTVSRPGCGSTSSYDYGSVATLTATANTGNLFSGWSGACSGVGTNCSIMMTGPKKVSAAFSPQIALEPTPDFALIEEQRRAEEERLRLQAEATKSAEDLRIQREQALRVERERLAAAEQAKREQAVREEQERLAAAELLERERVLKEEQDRLAAELLQRQQALIEEQARLDAESLKREQELQEMEDRLTAERVEAERALIQEQERLDADRLQREQEQLDREQTLQEEQDRLDRDRLKSERERQEEQDRLDAERLKQEREQIQSEQAMQEEQRLLDQRRAIEAQQRQDELDKARFESERASIERERSLEENRARLDQERLQLEDERLRREAESQREREGLGAPPEGGQSPGGDPSKKGPARGFFTNSEIGKIGAVNNFLDPASLAVIGILITLIATLAQLVKGN